MPRHQNRPFTKLLPETIDKFWSHFIARDPNECWPWDGLFIKGYGYLSTPTGNWLASRLMFYIKYGIDPGDLSVCHTCDNPPCVNWDHFFLGTQSENTLDRHAKGRTVMPTVRAFGENAPCVKLTCDDVRQIHILRQAGCSYPKLGRIFSVSHQNIRDIIIGKIWRHVI